MSDTPDPSTADRPTRERSHTWHDPAELAAAARSTDGLTFLTALAAGEHPAPPVVETLGGMRAVAFSDGRAVFELDPAEWHYNPIGSVHGGVLTTLADSALGCAVHTKLPAGTGYTSLELKINFTRAVTVETGTVTCTAEVITFGRRTATASATLTDRTGRILGHASTTCLILA